MDTTDTGDAEGRGISRVQRRITPEAQALIQFEHARGARDDAAVWLLLSRAVADGVIPGPVPSMRTVKRMLDELTEVYEGSAAGLNALSVDELPAAIETLAEVIRNTDGRTDHVTPAEAERLKKIVRIDPEIDRWLAYRLAREYVLRAIDHTGTQDLDALLSFKPWKSELARNEYRCILKARPALRVPLHLSAGTVVPYVVDGEDGATAYMGLDAGLSVEWLPVRPAVQRARRAAPPAVAEREPSREPKPA